MGILSPHFGSYLMDWWLPGRIAKPMSAPPAATHHAALFDALSDDIVDLLPAL